MSASIKTKSSLDDIIDEKIYIDQNKNDVFKMVFKPNDNDDNNIEKEFIIKPIYILNPKEIIGHIAYTNRTVTVINSPSIVKSFINYIYLKKYEIVVIIDELIAGIIEDIVPNDEGDNPKYIEFSKDFLKKNYIKLSFIFQKSEGVEIIFYNRFFENDNDDKKYYFTSGKCNDVNNSSYYINSFYDEKKFNESEKGEKVTGYLFYAFLQIFYPEKIYNTLKGDFYIHEKYIEKANELDQIVKNVYKDSKDHPEIKKYYSIPDSFKIFENDKNETVDLEILSKYFNLNCNIIEFEENKLINELKEIDREIVIIENDINKKKTESKNIGVFDFTSLPLKKKIELEIKKLVNDKSNKETEKINLVNELKKLESNKDSIPIKNIPLNNSPGCKLYPFIDENQIYPYTFCNLDGKNWYLKKHNCEIDYDKFKGGAKERYEGLKSKNTLDINILQLPPNADNMNIQKINDFIKILFAKKSCFIKSKGNKYLFTSVDKEKEKKYTEEEEKKEKKEEKEKNTEEDTEEEEKDTKNIIDFQDISDLKDEIEFKQKPEESRSIYSYEANIRIKNINKSVYQIVYNDEKFYVIPL